MGEPDSATSQMEQGFGTAMWCPARVRFSTVMALMLAILGSSVLPVSYAFATTGILSGLVMAVV
jgi:hypothetical protein